MSANLSLAETIFVGHNAGEIKGAGQVGMTMVSGAMATVHRGFPSQT
jgi:hypothetical protein